MPEPGPGQRASNQGATVSSARTPLAIAGALLLTSAPFGVFVFGDARPFREIAGTAPHLTHYALTLLAMLALAVAVPHLRGLRGPSGQRLPQPVVAAALVATVLTACTHFVQVFVTPFLADVAPVALDEQGGGLMAGLVGSWLLFLGAWTTLGVVGLRRGVLPRGTGVLIVAAALLQPAIGPLAVIPLGAALLALSRSDRAPDAAPAPLPAPLPA